MPHHTHTDTWTTKQWILAIEDSLIHTPGIWSSASCLFKAFESYHGIPLKKLDVSFNEMSKSYPELFAVVDCQRQDRPGRFCFHIRARMKEIPFLNDDDGRRGDVKDVDVEVVRNRLLSLIKPRECTDVSELPRLYQSLYNTSLDASQYGFIDMLDMVSHLTPSIQSSQHKHALFINQRIPRRESLYIPDPENDLSTESLELRRRASAKWERSVDTETEVRKRKRTGEDNRLGISGNGEGYNDKRSSPVAGISPSNSAALDAVFKRPRMHTTPDRDKDGGRGREVEAEINDSVPISPTSPGTPDRFGLRQPDTTTMYSPSYVQPTIQISPYAGLGSLTMNPSMFPNFSNPYLPFNPFAPAGLPSNISLSGSSTAQNVSSTSPTGTSANESPEIVTRPSSSSPGHSDSSAYPTPHVSHTESPSTSSTPASSPSTTTFSLSKTSPDSNSGHAQPSFPVPPLQFDSSNPIQIRSNIERIIRSAFLTAPIGAIPSLYRLLVSVYSDRNFGLNIGNVNQIISQVRQLSASGQNQIDTGLGVGMGIGLKPSGVMNPMFGASGAGGFLGQSIGMSAMPGFDGVTGIARPVNAGNIGQNLTTQTQVGSGSRMNMQNVPNASSGIQGQSMPMHMGMPGLGYPFGPGMSG
ncbi:hypothetical protein BKA69DRAFT_1126077 [Paraphysoderma sedebokerense]|nr:hypothetical protein BKA69DRAFT_1126077 [Paraphysoderma sedebokerense]